MDISLVSGADVCQYYSARPYINPPNATTSSNLSAPPINSPDPSPSADESSADGSFLPDADLPTHQPLNNKGFGQDPDLHPERGGHSLVPLPAASTTSVPSPLSQEASAALPLPDIASNSPSPIISNQKSKKLLAKEAKAAEKHEAKELTGQRAEMARAMALEKKAHKEADLKAKEQVKQKKEEEKARLKTEKKAKKLQSTSYISLPSPFKKAQTADVPPVPPIPATLASTPKPDLLPPSAENHRFSSPNFAVDGRQRGVSMPHMDAISSSTPTEMQGKPAEPSSTGRSKLGMLGALRKRLSVFGSDVRPPDTSGSSNVNPTAWTDPITPFPANPPRLLNDISPMAFSDSTELQLPSDRSDFLANRMTNSTTQLHSEPSQAGPWEENHYTNSPAPYNSEQTPSSSDPVSVVDPPSTYYESSRQYINTLPALTNPDVSVPLAPQSLSHQSTPPIVIIDRTPARNGAEEYRYSGSPTRQHSPHVRGPRAMHYTSRSRADSIGTLDSAERQIAPALDSSEFPFVPRAEIATPSPSSELSGLNRSSDLLSPFTSEDSRQSSMTSDGFDVNRVMSNGVMPSGRDGSKDYNATMQRDVGPRRIEGTE